MKTDDDFFCSSGASRLLLLLLVFMSMFPRPSRGRARRPHLSFFFSFVWCLRFFFWILAVLDRIVLGWRAWGDYERERRVEGGGGEMSHGLRVGVGRG